MVAQMIFWVLGCDTCVISIPTVDGRNPANQLIGTLSVVYREFYIPGGARFLPSTVWIKQNDALYNVNQQKGYQSLGSLWLAKVQAGFTPSWWLLGCESIPNMILI